MAVDLTRLKPRCGVNPVGSAPAASIDGSSAVDVLVLMACYNRRENTLAVLRDLCMQRTTEALDLAAVVYDAGSDDGTADAVIADFPWVQLIRGETSVYWARSMEITQRHGLAVWAPRYLLWLNDDTALNDDALARALGIARMLDDQTVVTGALRDRETGVTTYTAMRRAGRRPTQLERVHPTDSAQPVDTFNGNFVLVPHAVYTAVGAIDGRFEHAYGDIDYGFRVAEAGFRTVLAPGYVGSCSRNAVTATWRDSTTLRRERLGLLLGPKAMPVGPYVRFLRKHGPLAWPVYAIAGYAKAVSLIARRQSIGGWELATDEEPPHVAKVADRA